MNILLIGANGKMGQEVAKIAHENGDKIIAGIDRKKNDLNEYPIYDNYLDLPKEIDVVIDFSTANDRKDLIKYLREERIPYGLFSTTASEEDKNILKECSKKFPVLICQNSSEGMNVFYKAVDLFSQKLNSMDVEIEEYHHKQKRDIPSGTAKNIESLLEKNNVNYKTYSHRVGNEKGTHIVRFYLEDEIIEIKHKANSRRVFALGAVRAMKHLKNKKRGLYYDILDL